jgi:Putative peptidoglycan binding domain
MPSTVDCDDHPPNEAIKFLTRNGYLQSGSKDQRDSAVSALKQFQARHKLPVTGLLTKSTKALMSGRKCGAPDIRSSPSTGTPLWNEFASPV